MNDIDKLAQALHARWVAVAWSDAPKSWQEELRKYASAALAWFDANNPLAADVARLEVVRDYNAELVRQRDEEIRRLREDRNYWSELVDERDVWIAKLRERAETAEAELARLRSDENDNLTAVYMAGRHDGRKQRLDSEAEQIKQEAAELRSALAGKTPEPEPVADAQTIEDLARIGYCASPAIRPSGEECTWSCLSPAQRDHYINRTAAILRAAKPYVDMTDDDADDIAEHFGISELMRIANTHIRYAVAIEPTDAEIEALAHKLYDTMIPNNKNMWRDTGEYWQNEWRAVARAAWVHLRGGK